MRFKHTLFLVCALLITLQPAFAQSWGQLKSQAQEAQAAKDYAGAGELWTKALAACDNSTGPRFIQSMSGLAHNYAEQEKYADADACYKKIVDLALSGTLSDDSKAALSDYAALLRKQKREAEAADLESRFSLVRPAEVKAPAAPPAATAAPAIDQKAKQRDELRNCKSLLNTGAGELARKNFPQAEKLFKQALAECEKKDETLRGESIKKLMSLYCAQNKLGEALPYFRQSLEITRQASGSRSKEYAQALLGYGQLLRKLNRKSEAMAEEARAEIILAGSAADSSTGPAAASGSFSGQPTKTDTSVTRRGSVVQRARAAQKGFNDATNQMINSPE